jgi:threonine dehydratase
MSRTKLPSIDDIKEAAERISQVAVRTPLVESPALSRKFGRQVFLKLECFQPIRVFKIRGAYNKISRLKANNIVAISSGNHGLAVAYCCHMLGKKCTVIVPETIVQEKFDAMIEFDAKVIKYGKFHADREAKAHQMVSETGSTLVHPFNDPEIIAGQGTCGLEICQQLEDFDSVIVPVGGGGLISGISIAIKTLRPKAKVFGVEPSGAAKMQLALKSGKPVSIDSPKTIADGLMPSIVGDLTLKACRRFVDEVFSISDPEILDGMRMLIRDAHIFPEPSGSASLALLAAKRDVYNFGNRIVLVVSGGNVSLELLKQNLA